MSSAASRADDSSHAAIFAGDSRASEDGDAVTLSTSSPAPAIAPARTPAWAYILLLVSILAMSSGGIWFALLDEATPPLLKAAWRLLLTAVLQAPGFAVQSRSVDAVFWDRLRGETFEVCLIGLSLGAHFGAWGYSVAHTSLTHSLVLVWSTPLVLVALLFARSFIGRGPAPTRREILGALVGFGGVAVMLAAAGSVAAGESKGAGQAVTLAGDVAALFGGSVIIYYLEGGARLRQWVPVFIFAFPVNIVASAVLFVTSVLFEGASVVGTGASSVFGFWGDGRRFGIVLCAAAVSGVLGHTAMNASVKHLSPLILSVAALWEPVLGSLLGYALNLNGAPSALTALAAVALLAGGLLVSWPKK